MHSRLYIHLPPLQAAESSLVAFDHSIQLFIEVVEVLKLFCTEHNFHCRAEMQAEESGSKIFRALGCLENISLTVNSLIIICRADVKAQAFYCK